MHYCSSANLVYLPCETPIDTMYRSVFLFCALPCTQGRSFPCMGLFSQPHTAISPICTGQVGEIFYSLS